VRQFNAYKTIALGKGSAPIMLPLVISEPKVDIDPSSNLNKEKFFVTHST
jgi:hypothetical protein